MKGKTNLLQIAFTRSIKIITLLILFWMMINILCIILKAKVIDAITGIMVSIIILIVILFIKLLHETGKE